MVFISIVTIMLVKYNHVFALLKSISRFADTRTRNMCDCRNLLVIQRKTLNGMSTGITTRCELKSDLSFKLSLAQAAIEELEVQCPPNDECHFYSHNRCDRCPSYQTA